MLFYSNNFILVLFTSDSIYNSTSPPAHLTLHIYVKLIAWKHHIHQLPFFCNAPQLPVCQTCTKPSFQFSHLISQAATPGREALSFAFGLLPSRLDTLSNDIKSMTCFPTHCCYAVFFSAFSAALWPLAMYVSKITAVQPWCSSTCHLPLFLAFFKFLGPAACSFLIRVSNLPSCSSSARTFPIS